MSSTLSVCQFSGPLPFPTAKDLGYPRAVGRAVCVAIKIQGNMCGQAARWYAFQDESCGDSIEARRSWTLCTYHKLMLTITRTYNSIRPDSSALSGESRQNVFTSAQNPPNPHALYCLIPAANLSSFQNAYTIGQGLLQTRLPKEDCLPPLTSTLKNQVVKHPSVGQLQISLETTRSRASNGRRRASIPAEEHGRNPWIPKQHEGATGPLQRTSGSHPPNRALRSYLHRTRQERMLRKSVELDVCLKTARQQLELAEDKYWELMYIIDPPSESEGNEEGDDVEGEVVMKDDEDQKSVNEGGSCGFEALREDDTVSTY